MLHRAIDVHDNTSEEVATLVVRCVRWWLRLPVAAKVAALVATVVGVSAVAGAVRGGPTWRARLAAARAERVEAQRTPAPQRSHAGHGRRALGHVTRRLPERLRSRLPGDGAPETG